MSKAPKISRNIAALTTLSAAVVLGSSLGFSQPARAFEYNIQNAAGLYFTPNGEDYLKTNLQGVLKSRGVDLSSREIPEVAYTSTKAISLSHLPAGFQKFQGVLTQARDLITDWLVGFQLNDPKISGKATDLKYTATFKQLSVRADRDLSKGRTDGVIFVLEVVVPQFRFDVAKVLGTDSNNKVLGSFGAKKLFLELNDDAHPFKVQLPVRVNIHPDGTLELQAQSVTTNLPALNFKSGLQLVLPRIQLKLGTQVSTLDTRVIDAKLRAQEPALVKVLQKYIEGEIEARLVTEVNSLMAPEAAKGFTLDKSTAAPGAPTGSTQPNLAYSMKPSGIDIGEGGLELSLSGYVQDPTVPFDASPIVGVKAKPALGFQDVASYDFALAVNQTFVNQMLRLSFDRGNFDQVDGGGGQTLRLTQAPFFWPGQTPGTARLRVVVKHETSGLKEDIGLVGPIEIELEMDVEFVANANNTIDVRLRQINEDWFGLDDRFIRFQSLKSEVYAAVKAELHQKNLGFGGKKMLATGIQVPSDISGVPIKLKAANLDPNGHLVFYMEWSR